MHLGSRRSSAVAGVLTQVGVEMAGISDVLGELSDQDVEWVVAAGERRDVTVGAVVVVEGELPAALFIVLEGELSAFLATGEEIRRLASGDVVGEISFADASPASATVTATSDAAVYAIPRVLLEAKLALDAGFAARFYRAMSVFLAHRLRHPTGARSGTASSSAETRFLQNVHLAAARSERMLTRMDGPSAVTVTGSDLTIESVVRVAYGQVPVQVSRVARERVAQSAAIVNQLAREPAPIYGLTTGLGAFSSRPIAPEDNARFQANVLLSHAAGVGAPFDSPVVRAIMLARLNGLARGGAGIQLGAFDLLTAMLNAGIHPVVPSRGSIGMSDLTHLAHLSLPLIGLGQVEYQGALLSAADALSRAGLQPVRLGGKDALALCSSNSASVGHGALVLAEAVDTLSCADIAAALTLEAYHGNVSPLAEELHTIRPYSGQLISAERMRHLLAGSSLWDGRGRRRIQDPLSLRCSPQVHGACLDALAFVRRTVETELNSTGDNPVVIAERRAIISNGNFHPAALAMGFDLAATALAQATSLATSRVLRLMDPELSGLPPQLTPEPGVNTGFGILQKTVTALNAESRFLAAPASLDFMAVASSIEDHATMATRCAAKAGEIVDNARYVLAIELLCAAQAIDLRKPRALGVGTATAYECIRSATPFMAEDQAIAPAVDAIRELVASGRLLTAVTESSLKARTDGIMTAL